MLICIFLILFSINLLCFYLTYGATAVLLSAVHHNGLGRVGLESIRGARILHLLITELWHGLTLLCAVWLGALIFGIGYLAQLVYVCFAL